MHPFGILAYPASHSLSPAMHNAVFEEVQSNAVYGRYEISPKELHTFMKKWKSEETTKGLSVSLPHKESIMQYCDSIDEAAEYIGAVNTVYKKDGKIYGTNTDFLGFKTSLEQQYNPDKKRFLVLGAGGASKAIIYALLACNAQSIHVWNRTEQTAIDTVKQFSHISAQVLHVSTKNLPSISLETDCIINTTSVGMHGSMEDLSPFPKNLFQPFHSAFDIIYTPKETVFLTDCVNAGGKSMNGENMLLYQGLEQSKLFLKSLNISLPSEEKMESIMRNSLSLSSRTSEKWTPPKLSASEKNNILQTIVKYKEQELFLCREYTCVPEYLPEKQNIQTFRMYKALAKEKDSPHLIAEIKPASPSKGIIFKEQDSVESIAKIYAENGASCMSVLTDYPFFGALPENITLAQKTSDLPILRKDFIIHASQITQAAELGASAVLLMRSVLSASQIQTFIEHASSLSLDCLVEVHDETELRDVLENTSANIIGVNTRDLKTLSINPENFSVLLDIAKQYPHFHEKIWVAESGISSKADIQKYAQGAHAVLVGTGILQSEKREEKVKELSR